jgi:hypothetical protein
MDKVAETGKPAVKEPEYFTFMGVDINVTKAKEIIESNKEIYKCNDIDVEKYVKQICHTTDPKTGKTYYDEPEPKNHKGPMTMNLGIGINYEHAKKVKLEGYVIGIQLSEQNGGLIIDGWHRIFRAWKDGVKTLPCYYLPREVARKLVNEPRLRKIMFG